MTASDSEAVPPFSPSWRVRGRTLLLARPLVMGILNVTPDSFSDGGLWTHPKRALEHARRMVAEGADILDIGGESTRPGAQPVPPEQERARVLPVVRQCRAELSVPLSVDTRRAEVAEAALEAGAEIINDVSALGDPQMAATVGEAGAGLVLMHMRGTPQTMQLEPHYEDVVGEVVSELGEALERARQGGIAEEQIVVDPGIGFGKTAAHNLELIARLDRLRVLRRPLLLGPSRKQFLSALLGDIPPDERDVATAAACVVGLLRGARIFRVHNVAIARQALAVAEALRRAAPEVP